MVETFIIELSCGWQWWVSSFL